MFWDFVSIVGDRGPGENVILRLVVLEALVDCLILNVSYFQNRNRFGVVPGCPAKSHAPFRLKDLLLVLQLAMSTHLYGDLILGVADDRQRFPFGGDRQSATFVWKSVLLGGSKENFGARACSRISFQHVNSQLQPRPHILQERFVLPSLQTAFGMPSVEVVLATVRFYAYRLVGCGSFRWFTSTPPVASICLTLELSIRPRAIGITL